MMRLVASLLVASLLLTPSGIAHSQAKPHNGLITVAQQNSPARETSVVGIPPQGKLYNGIYPGGVTGEEDDIRPENLSSYEQLAGKSAAWVYFSDNWYKGPSFPTETATWIRSTGSIPFIRLMLRSSPRPDVVTPTFTLERIINGTFDDDLRKWAQAARNFSTPLLVEYGTEVNGMWFPWNGFWNGGDDLGPQRFRSAYCHIVQIMRNESANNITWVFHVNFNDVPDEPWNHLENYYPGDKCVDWIGVSVYGPQSPMDNNTRQFSEMMDQVYPRLASLNATKPIVLLEFGASSHNPGVDQATWAGNALANLTALRWPRVIGFSWWNEAWANDANPAHNSDMRLQDNPALAAVFKKYVGLQDNVLGRMIMKGIPVNTTTTTTSTISSISSTGTESISQSSIASQTATTPIPEFPKTGLALLLLSTLVVAVFVSIRGGRGRKALQP